MRIMSDRTDGEARAYCETLEHIFAHYQDIEISEQYIMHLHEELFKYSEKDGHHRGLYKQADNKVETKDRNGKVLRVLLECTPADRTPQALRDLVTWVNSALISGIHHPLVVISAFTVEFFKIHPFHDGNGRVGRMLINLLLLKAGYGFELHYPYEKIIEDDKEAYYLALSNSQKTFGTDNESILIWTEYFLRLLLKQAQEVTEVIGIEEHVRVPA